MGQGEASAFFALSAGSAGVLGGPPPMAGSRIADLEGPMCLVVSLSHGYVEIPSDGLEQFESLELEL